LTASSNYMDLTVKALLFLTAQVMALIAGLFYSYSCSVNPGLATLSDSEYLRAMLNPWFFLSFIGSLLVTPTTIVLYYTNVGADATFYLLLAAFVLYFIGVFGVTVLGNVPLNNSLDAFQTELATEAEMKNKRINFEIPWNRLHTIRTFANFIALILVLVALVIKID
jgi:uncharacterized membrane protein